MSIEESLAKKYKVQQCPDCGSDFPQGGHYKMRSP